MERKLASLRRKLTGYTSSLQSIKEWGKKATSDPNDKESVAYFRGMLKHLESTFAKFEDVWQELDSLQDEGVEDIPTSSDAELRKNARSHYFMANKHLQVLNMVETESTKSENLAVLNASLSNESKITRSLPKLQLTRFDGQPSEWPRFRDSFVSLVDSDRTMPHVDKLHYLRASLVGPAFSVISHLNVSDANYAIAWKAILDEFDNKRLLAASYLDKILSTKPITGKASAESLKVFLSNIGDSVAAFKLLTVTNPAEFIMFHLAVRNLDSSTREQFEIANKDNEFPTIDGLLKFVRERATSLMLASSNVPTVNLQHTPPPTKTNKPPNPKNFPKMTLLVQEKGATKKTPSNRVTGFTSQSTNSNSNYPTCIVCKNQCHHLLSCERFHASSVEEKWTSLARWKGCINCLSPKHTVQSCTSKWKCRFCPERHHSSLHRNTTSPEISPMQGPSQTRPPTDHTLNSISQEDGQVILGTALIEVLDARGEFQPIRVILDSGSQNSFITHKCLNKLGLTMQHLKKRISGIGQTPFEGTKAKTTSILRPRNRHFLQLKTEVIVVSNITSYLPARTLSPDFVKQCSGFELADPIFWKPSVVDFLIGADLYAQVMTGSILPIEGSQASLFSSIFGYIVLGKIADSSEPHPSTSLFTTNSDYDLNQQLRKFWELEEPSTPRSSRNPEEEQCEKHFCQTHAHLSDGRYSVRLPFKEDPPSVGDSSYVARKRFLNLEKKLEANSVLKKSYHETIEEYLELTHMARATRPTQFIIPHHCVTKEENNSLKIRIVFDASVPVRDGTLNEHLLVGEKLQRDVRDVVLSFRQHRFVFSTDIVKMFRMVAVDHLDRGFLQIYWRFNKEEGIELLELQTLPFGLVCSPFLALRVLKQLCQDHGKDYPLAAHVLERDIYVDDILTGASAELEAIRLKEQLVDLLKKGGFHLSKWVSNSPVIMKSTQGGVAKSVVSLADKEDTWVKLLGLQWDPEEDTFLFSFQSPTPVYSKRGILSSVARLYDPLGFLTPVTLLMKGLVQHLWKLELDWDEPIPEPTKQLWDTILGELHLLSALRIPRFLHTTGNYEGHVVGFSDASLRGYAAVLYLRVCTTDHNAQVTLLTSKSKLAPIKATSIPRLELSDALLLAQLYSANTPFFDSLPAPFKPPTFHTDSSIVLGWLNTPSFRLQTFVANRVAKVQELTSQGTWRHVNTEENPCDVASRGILPSQIIRDELWWQGPLWLQEPEANWPPPAFAVPTDLPERKSMSVTLVARYTDNPLIAWMTQISNFFKILRIMAWVKRWIYNIKHLGCCCCNMRTGPLKSFELQLAQDFCIKLVQEHYFFKGQPFKKVAENYADLQPFLDSRDLVRVGGRLRRADLADSQKFPILLPTEAYLTVLIVDHYHRLYLHPGPNLLRAIIQKSFWVPSLRRLINARGFRCMTCYRSKAKAATPLMGDLPSYRVNGGRAFLHVGVDFAGPFQMKESSRRKAQVNKVYLCLFICMATKALHLEVVTRLSTEAFVAALERFAARRGLPSDMYSDRGSNFIGAAHYLSDLETWFRTNETMEGILDYTTRTHITWHFNPPLTTHMGGIWEAGVKSVKSHLYKVVGETILTFEELATLFSKIEAILNSRPICPLSASPEETEYLSPGHFLVGGPLVTVPQPSYLDMKENLLDRWQLVYAIGQRFWQRWRAEYLATLQRRPKWMARTENLKIGDIVILKEEQGKPLSWPIAKVLDIHPGEDGIVRVATVKTATTTYQRPAVKLIPLLPLKEPSFPK